MSHFITKEPVLTREKVRVTKIDAARRQLDCAIELWFANGDIVSITTLAGAAHQIVHDIHRKRGGFVEALFNWDGIADPTHRKDWIHFWTRDILGFLKHGYKDPEAEIDLAVVTSVGFIMAAIKGLAHLTHQHTYQAKAFACWIAIYQPDWIKGEPGEVLANFVPIKRIGGIEGLGRQEFLAFFRAHCAS